MTHVPPPWHVSSSTASSFPPRDRGPAADSAARIVPTAPAGVYRSDSDAGPAPDRRGGGSKVRARGRLPCRRPTPRRSVTLPRGCEHAPAEPAHARCGRAPTAPARPPLTPAPPGGSTCPREIDPRCRRSSNPIASGASIERRLSAGFDGKGQCRLVHLLVVQPGTLDGATPVGSDARSTALARDEASRRYAVRDDRRSSPVVRSLYARSLLSTRRTPGLRFCP